MKTVICALNSKYIHSSLAPWYLLAAVNDKDCCVIEGTINESLDAVYERITSNNPSTVAFSTYIWNKQSVLSLAERLKREKNVTIILGGPEVSYNPREILENHQFADIVISGEGEEPFADIYRGKPLEEIDGICYKKSGDVVIKPPFVSKNDPPNPYTKEYMEALNGRIAYLETSRGCPFSCAFCLSGRCGGVRFFDLEQAKRNIILLANSGTKTVKFIDRTFNADKKRARELFEFIIQRRRVDIPDNVCFHFEIEGELLDESTFSVLKKAPVGLFQFEIGIQSFNEETLNGINRRCNIELLCENISRLVSMENIHIHIDLIAGLPFETFESFRDSFNKAYRLNANMLQLGFLKILHGADLEVRTEEQKCEFSHTPPYEIISNAWISEKEIKMLKGLEEVVERLYNSSRFALTCKYLCSVYKTPFDAYFGLAQALGEEIAQGITLDDFTLLVYRYYSSESSVDKSKLRDALAIDRLATNRMGALPDFLKVKCKDLKKILCDLDKNETTKRAKNVKRSATPLLSENKVAYVDYDHRDYLTNRFLVKFTKL